MSSKDQAWDIDPQTGRTRTKVVMPKFDQRGAFSAPSPDEWGASSMENAGRAGDPRPRGGPAPAVQDKG